MNQTQKRYAIQRCTEICDQVMAQYEVDHKEKNTVKAVTLSDREMIKLIRTGKVKLFSQKYIEDNVSIYRTNNIENIFDFSQYASASYIRDEDLMLENIERIRTHKQQICDDIMLGDSAAALKSIMDLPKTLKGLIK